jgi:hypothetical protein
MTKKDYKLIAEAIADMKSPPLAKLCWAEHLADHFEKRDKTFNRQAFLEWCGVLG